MSGKKPRKGARQRTIDELRETLRRSQEVYTHLVEGSGSVILLADKDLNIRFMNQYGLNFFGYSPEEIIGRNAVGTIIPRKDEQGRDLAAMAEDLQQHPGDYATNVHQNRRKDGSLVWMSWANKAICNERGEAVEILAIGNDLTSLKRTESALHESEIRYHSLFEHMLNGFAYCQMLYDRSGRPDDFVYLAVNEAFGKLTGLKEVVGRRVTELIPRIKELTPEVFEVYGRVAASGAPESFEIDFTPLTRWLSVSVYSPQKGYFAAVFDDITARKAGEHAVRASLREKEALLKEIHHRVKNNMQVISSLVKLQASCLTEPKLVSAFRELLNRVRSMALVHETLYKSESLAEVQFADYTRSLTNYLTDAYGAKGIRFRLDLNPVSISSDHAIPCGLILSELISNALKHAFPNRSSGEISIGLYADDSKYVEMRVADNGAGFPPDVDWRQTVSLGLRLVNLLITQLKASAEMNSSALGTKFNIRFPVM